MPTKKNAFVLAAVLAIGLVLPGLVYAQNCRTGGRCALAAKSLQDLDLTDVTAVDMKIDDWAKAGYPLVK
jgi:rhodanese-related sulfurtransferase